MLDEPGEEERSGPGNIEFGVKWRFLGEQQDRFAMSIYPQVDVNPPGNSERRGLIEDGADFILPVQIARSFGETRVYGEIGYVWREHRRDGWFYGVAFEHPISGVFRCTGEIRGVAEGDFSDSELFFSIGFKARLTEHVILLASSGRTIRKSPGDDAGVFSYVGLQFTF